MTLTFRDKVILLVIALAVGVYFGYQALWIPADAKITELKENKQSIQSLAGDLEPLLKETEHLKKAEKDAKDSVNNIKKLSGGLTATKEEFLVFLGDSSKKNNVTVSGFNELGTEVKNGIYRTVFDFELKGNSVDINKILEDINNIGIKCSFGSFSYRQNEGYDYLKRFFDELTELHWYKEKEEEEQKDNAKDDKKSEETKEEQQENKNDEEDVKPLPPPEPEVLPQQPEPIVPDVPNVPDDSFVPPVEDKQPESLEDRLNDLLLETSFPVSEKYSIVFLENAQKQQGKNEYKPGQQMKLNVTVCLIMYNEPSVETSFLKKMESDSNEIL